MSDDLVLKCVTDHNRPFNVQCVADLLATRGVKKPQAQRSLDALAGANKLRCKEFGKTKLYYPNQDVDILDKEEVQKGILKVTELQAAVTETSQSLRLRQRDLAALQNAMTIEQLQEKLAGLTEKVHVLEAKVGPMRSGESISVEDSEALNKVFSANMDAWARRKRMFNNIWDIVGEGIDRKEADVFEDIGIDTDAAMNVSHKDFANLLNKRRR